jgi:type IV secretory pathway VirB3-like protein
MMNEERMPWDELAVGATRPSVIRGLNVPYWFVIPVIGVPFLITAVSGNPFWLVAIVPMAALVQWLVATDHNRPRILMLALLSGSLFGERRRWGGVSADPFGKTPLYD